MALTSEVKKELQARRDEWWAHMSATAVGVFVALVVYGLLVLAVLRIWVDSAFE